MKIRKIIKSMTVYLALGLAALSFNAPTLSRGQTGQGEPKIIYPPDTHVRPAAKSRAKRFSTAKPTESGPRYQATRNSSFGKRPPKGMTYGNLGVTVMRMRPATAKDIGDAAKEVTNKREVVFERIEDSSKLVPGDQVRISVESPLAGYLYVVNREEYGDGTFGRALLIFPTLVTYDGDNRIEARLPRILPDPRGVFEIRPKNGSKVLVAEQLTIIISARPLTLPPIAEKEMELPAGWVEKWQQDWGGRTDRASLVGGVGQTQTKREQTAGRLNVRELRNKRTEVLTDNDPWAQNCYRVTIKPGTPTLVVLRLPLQQKLNQ